MFIKSLVAVDNFTVRTLYFLNSTMGIKTTATVTVTFFIWWLWLNESLLIVLSIMIYLSWLNFLKICWVLLLKDKTYHLEKMSIWWRWIEKSQISDGWLDEKTLRSITLWIYNSPPNYCTVVVRGIFQQIAGVMSLGLKRLGVFHNGTVRKSSAQVANSSTQTGSVNKKI